MTPFNLHKLCCPFDRSALRLVILEKDTAGNVLEGELSCGACTRRYPIIAGIPVLVPDEYRDFTLEENFWARWRRQRTPPQEAAPLTE